MNPKDYDRTENIILNRFFDNFQDNRFCLHIFYRPDSPDDRLESDLELIRRPIMLQIGHLYFANEFQEEEDDDF